MNKGTNIGERALEIIFKSIIPIALICALTTEGFKSTFINALTFSAYMVNLEKISNIVSIKKVEDIETVEKVENEVVKVETNDSIIVSSNATLAMPTDIQRLIKAAEKKYENSSIDGQIIECDYSVQNATAEYNGIYLRNTTLNHDVNIEEYLKRQVCANIDKSKPSVLIYHTHTTETYELLDRGFYTNERNTRSENSKENMVRIGEEICRILESNGYKTIHDKTIYDEHLSGAYDRARKNISKILKDNPSIQIVLDIHRDSIYQKNGSKIKTVAEIDGRKAAQIMLISGCEDGNVTNFPNWQKNLTFAINLQHKITADNKTLMRPLMFCSRKYNMDLIPCALSVEIGTDANTLSEAVYSAGLFATSLSEFLEEYKIE